MVSVAVIRATGILVVMTKHVLSMREIETVRSKDKFSLKQFLTFATV